MLHRAAKFTAVDLGEFEIKNHKGWRHLAKSFEARLAIRCEMQNIPFIFEHVFDGFVQRPVVLNNQ